MCNDADFNSALVRVPCCLSSGSLKRGFLDIYLTTFSESVISKLQNIWPSSFLSKCWKFQPHFKNAVKNWEKVLCFWCNCKWIGIFKLSLLTRGYFSSAANILTSRPKIGNIKNRDFFQLIWLSSNQWSPKT